MWQLFRNWREVYRKAGFKESNFIVGSESVRFQVGNTGPKQRSNGYDDTIGVDNDDDAIIADQRNTELIDVPYNPVLIIRSVVQ